MGRTGGRKRKALPCLALALLRCWLPGLGQNPVGLVLLRSSLLARKAAAAASARDVALAGQAGQPSLLVLLVVVLLERERPCRRCRLLRHRSRSLWSRKRRLQLVGGPPPCQAPPDGRTRGKERGATTASAQWTLLQLSTKRFRVIKFKGLSHMSSFCATQSNRHNDGVVVTMTCLTLPYLASE